jgi:hypothetical protein
MVVVVHPHTVTMSSEQLDIETFTAETTASFAAMNSAQLIGIALRERNTGGWGTARGSYLHLLRDEMTKRSISVETIRETGVVFLDEV